MQYKKYVTASGEEHGCINYLGNSCEDNDFKYATAAMKEKLKAQRKDESRIVAVTYINMKGSNERLQKPYMRWAGDPITMWNLIPNETYEVPYGFVKEINEEALGLAKRSEILDEHGVPTKRDDKAEKIHRLVPAAF